jgi:FkbH-like protein
MNTANINSVKFVIWDLDETYWNGTLSEGEIDYIYQNHNIIIELTKRGIINGICSKNNLETVRTELEKYNIWDYFVFPCVSWESKGPRLNALIKTLQLQAENILFIDDNIHNLEEASYYCKGIQTAEPSILSSLLELDQLKGKPDTELSRLHHYKILQQRNDDRTETQTDNIEFLRKSNIQVVIENNVLCEIDRVHEMLQRTNQLNFTKKRSSKEELVSLLSDPETESAYITVSDNYGDYGIVGFYAVNNNQLIHLLFSCRVLNMGIEQWLYKKLNKPIINIIADVSSSLDTPDVVDWINQNKKIINSVNARSKSYAVDIAILIKGTCDYNAMLPFITPLEEVNYEFNYNGNAPLPIRNEHTEILKNSTLAFRKKYKDVLERMPFVDDETYKSQVYDKNYDTLIYNITMDYTYGLYQYRDSTLIIPYQDYTIDMTNKSDWPKISNLELYPDGFLEWFSSEFKFLGPISIEKFSENIHWLCNDLLKDKNIIFVNGTEINFPLETQPDRWKHHAAMNLALEKAINELDNASICDVREIITTKDITININRFTRHGYYKLAKKLQEILSKTSNMDIINVNYVSYIVNSFLPKIYKFPLKVIKFFYKKISGFK